MKLLLSHRLRGRKLAFLLGLVRDLRLEDTRRIPRGILFAVSLDKERALQISLTDNDEPRISRPSWLTVQKHVVIGM